ncbi:glycosyltransferase, partial [Rheinheimera baltica]|uniref:glycosyltransferase n=1 Tax=Rheinheimera baltica TaxID=67576 RepID=UPI00273D8908
MKIAFYLENKNIKSVDLREPEKGNPGIGGTEFNFVTLPLELHRRYDFLQIKIFAQSTQLLPQELSTEQADNCLIAVEKALEQGFEFFVWRPTVREDAAKLVERIQVYAIKFIIWAHNTPQNNIIQSLANAPNVRRFIPVGEWQKRAIYHSDIQHKLTRIHNGFYPFAYQGICNKDPNLVVYTGSLIPVKGFGLLAQAWPRVLEKCPNARLVVIGSGQLYNRNAKLGLWGVADEAFENETIIPYLIDKQGNRLPSVDFKGVMGVEKIPLLKQALCGVVNPTGKGENCPGSAIEFLAAGTAVVSAASEGILDVVDDGLTGLLGQGVQELAENLICMLKNPDYAEQLGKHGPEIVQQRFDYGKICDEWVRVFAEEQGYRSNSDNYFLPLSKNELQIDIAIRRACSTLPITQQFELYANVTHLNQRRYPLSAKQLSDGWELTSNGRAFRFPLGIPSVKLLMCSFGYNEWLIRKYTLPGFLDINGSDTVLDCGAFVGGFAYAAALLGCKVICVEPDSNNCRFIAENTAQFDNVSIECAGLYDCVGEMIINVVDNPVEHSMLAPDA